MFKNCQVISFIPMADLGWVGLGQRVAETPMMPIMEAPSGHLYIYTPIHCAKVKGRVELINR